MKINLKIKRNKREVAIRDYPVYSGNTVTSFKHFLITSETGLYGDAIMSIYVNDTDAYAIEKLGYAIIEKSYNDAVIYSVKLGVHDVINSHVFLRYPFEDKRFRIESVSDYVTDGGRHYYKLLLDSNHGIAVGDKECCGYSYMTLFDSDGNELSKITDWFVSEENNKLYVNTSSITAPENGWYIVLNFDQLVYNDVKDDSIGDIYPGDWHFYSELNSNVSIKIIYDDPNISVPIGISSDSDYLGLRQNEIVDDYYKKLTKDIVPDFINTEKTKYVPYVYSGSAENENGLIADKLNGPAAKIEFYLHFRNREKEIVYYDDNKPVYGGMPSESWTVESEDAIVSGSEIKYWNTFSDYYEITESNDNFFVGDLVGNLGYTDNDVLNRKKKIKQSFIRLSFFNSNDPLQTSMLFYSTIFFDVNKLYSKYIKLYTSEDYSSIMSDYSLSVENGDIYDNHWGLVLFDGNPAPNSTYSLYNADDLLTAELSVSSENDHSSSAEGFNLYLFSDDSPKSNEERTIYMKIEFNHAGYGRKFPMILWPNDNGVPLPLTKDNFYEYLYIPVIVSYDATNKKYFYYIKSAKNDTENNVIKLALFEPKIEPV